MVEVGRSGGGQEDDLLSQRPAKYRPHRPHRRKYCNFQGFRAGGTITGIDRQGMVIDRHYTYRPLIDRTEIRCLAAVLCSFWVSRSMRSAFFTSFTYLPIIALCVTFCRDNTTMHLASDYIHPYNDAGGRPASCRIRIYLPDDVRDAPVVVCSELPNNSGGSITNSAEVMAAGVIRTNRLPTPLVWLEHWPEESTDGGEETFRLVAFSSYEVTERAPSLGETRAWIGEASWKELDRASVEVLVRGKI